MADTQNEPYESVVAGAVAEIDRELEDLDAERQALAGRGRELMGRKSHFLIIEQVTLCILNAAPLAVTEQAWADAHPADYAAVKAATRGRRGSRVPQITAVQ